MYNKYAKDYCQQKINNIKTTVYSKRCAALIKIGVASFSRTQKLRPILKTIRLELLQEQNDNLVKNLNRKQFG